MVWSVGGKSAISQTTESGQSQARTTGNESSTQVTQRLSDSNIESLNSLFKTIQENLTGKSEFTRANAISDSEGIIKDLFTQYSQQLLPQIVGKASQGGAYNSTAAQLLADNAFAETIGKAAQVKTNAIAQYAQADAAKQQSLTQTLSVALQSLLQAKETTNLNSFLNSITNSSYKGKSTTQEHQIQAKFGK